MPKNDHPFRIGHYRPIYMWGGPGTIRMNRLKFMNQPVNEPAHHHPHTDDGARVVLDEMYCNWVHLMYNWGFPPEIEVEDWEDFRRAAEIYHQHGEKVFAYIQASNCVYDGSFKDIDWYARDPKGNKIFYYSGRYMCCLANPEWVAHLKRMIKGAIDRGADGIFFDNMWHGAMPLSLFGAWLGSAGCHCTRCQSEYKAASGNAIPREIDPEDSLVSDYLRYRSDQNTALIKELVEYANQCQPGTPASANDYVHFTQPTYIVYGQDIRDMAKIKEVTMIENFSLPRWDREERRRLANNALTIRHALAAMSEFAHLSVLSYDIGIGFDGVYAPRRYQQGIAEAAACGASMTIKGTEYFENGRHTVLTPVEFAPIQKVIGDYNHWLEANASLFTERRNLAPVGVLFPGERLWLNWPRLSSIYHGVAQTLTVNKIPWRVIYPGEDMEGVQVLLAFDDKSLNGPSEERSYLTINVFDLPGWQPEPPSLVARNRVVRSIVSWGAHALMDAYFSSKPVRVIFDGLGLPKIITQSTVFNLPPQSAQEALLSALPVALYPRVKSNDPLLVELWKRGEISQLHLVNYTDRSQSLEIEFGRRVSGNCLSPDGACSGFSGSEITIDLDIYNILTFT
jgi:hypothetical protein